MKKNEREIYYAFGGKLVGSKIMKRYVCEVVSLMEEKVVRHITATCWFFSSMEEAFAFTLIGNELKDQHLVLLSDDLLMQSPEQIRYTIAHEIAHIMLGHTNSILRQQSKKEIKKQEKEADAFARRYVQF